MSEETKPVETPSVEAVPVSANELVQPLAAEMPTPTAPSQEEMFSDDFPPDPNAPEASAANPSVKQITDKGGKVFNPDLHKVDGNGAPRLDKAGFFIPKNKGRKAGGGSSEKKPEDAQQETTQKASDFQNQTGVPDEFDNAAALYFDVATGVAVSVISEEWQPESAVEREGMVKAVAAYLRAKGNIEITPGQALLFAAIAYSGKRLSRPKTKERLTLWFIKIKSFFKKPQIQN